MFSLAWQLENLARPRTSRRINSDSELYYKAKEEDVIRGGEKKQEQFLGIEKYAFVQRYLENVSETHSFTTETSDSGIKTHEATSELGMEDISGKYLLLFGLTSMSELCFKCRSLSVNFNKTRLKIPNQFQA